ncbi:hypothetical protein EC912_10862 [Luteibacter rhizovicinus]|uniref:HEAT repeat domain-containing protein n=1 Tax=Luteibacter rhizovicinus TaxID=242606 RepID=A0A4R3YIP9_9GAMM|nr:hypothetical protein [Luteibacter rhizovicinus]TCV92070.1 hypothetical protein EC912_10862 [Luteibacter rhizovicinus]
MTPEERAARMRAYEDVVRERIAKWKVEQADLIRELAQEGVVVELVQDLMNRPNNYVHVLPILAKHLQRPYSQLTQEAISRSMAMRKAHPYWDLFARLYRALPPTNPAEQGQPEDGLAVALSSSMPKEKLPELIELLSDQRLGESRVLLLRALRRSRDPLAKEAIDRLKDDPALTKEIHSWRRRKKP